MPRLVLIHTVFPLIATFHQLAAEILPEVDCRHILDEPLLETIRLRGSLDRQDTERLRGHLQQAQAVQTDAVLVTCSTISPLVDSLRSAFTFPIVKIDEEMIRTAVEMGGRLGILATNPTTMLPTRRMLEEEALRTKRTIQVELILVENAFAFFLKGDENSHDRLVKQALLELSPRVDVVVLAQASMARVLDILPETERTKPVFSSPQLALNKIKNYFNRIYPGGNHA